MSYMTMDLSGSLEGYRVSAQVYKIFKFNQRIDFEKTVFAESLKVYQISGGVTVELTKDIDYKIPEECIADTDMSRAKLMDKTFDKELITGIQMIRGVEIDEPFNISITYQSLYPNYVKTAYIHNQPLNLTPELVMDLVNQVERLNLLTSGVQDTVSLKSSESLTFTIDETYSNPSNKVTDEEHIVAVSSGKYLIKPKGGSFYRDSIVVKHPASGATLVEGTDYITVGCNLPKTKVTSSTVPVYDFIFVMAPITGVLTIDYHAFGGEATLDNYVDIEKGLQNVVQYLNNAQFISAKTIGDTEPMTSIYERVDKLEDQVRRLQGTPSYGDMTTGNTIVMKLFSETPGLHWYTIASLNTIDGVNTVPCTADTFMFRFQSQLSHIQFTAAVSVDLNNNPGDRLICNIVAENFPRGYIPFQNYADIDKIIRPQMRIVWKEENSVSGAYLQLGFELNGMVEETVQIEDISGHESCWKLVPEIAASTTPQDDNFLLPNGTSTWSSYLDNAKQEHMLIPFKKGHLIWSGSIEMNRTDGWSVFETEDTYLDNITDIRKFAKLRLDIAEEDGFQFPVDVNFNSGTEHLKGHSSFTYQEQPVYINAEIWRSTAGKIVVRINWDVLAGAAANKMFLKDMVIFL